MTDPFVTVFYFAAALALVALAVIAADRYWAWRDFDRYRRLSRRAHRNLVKCIR